MLKPRRQDGSPDARASVPRDGPAVRRRGGGVGGDKPGAGVPPVDASERAAAGDAGGVAPRPECGGLAAPAVRHAWAALGHGRWTSAVLIADWQGVVEQEG